MSRSITGLSLLRWFAGLAGLAAVLGALGSLSLPLALHVVDRAGVPIGCGSAWHSDASTARREDSFNRQQHLLVSPQFVLSDYAGECGQRVFDRRWLALGVAGGGAAVVMGVFLTPRIIADRPTRRHVAGARSSDSISSCATL